MSDELPLTTLFENIENRRGRGPCELLLHVDYDPKQSGRGFLGSGVPRRSYNLLYTEYQRVHAEFKTTYHGFSNLESENNTLRKHILWFKEQLEKEKLAHSALKKQHKQLKSDFFERSRRADDFREHVLAYNEEMQEERTEVKQRLEKVSSQLSTKETQFSALMGSNKLLRVEKAALRYTLEWAKGESKRKCSLLEEKVYNRSMSLLAVGRLLSRFGALPFVTFLDLVDDINFHVYTAAKYIADNVVHHSPQASQKELDRAIVDANLVLGKHLVGLIQRQADQPSLTAGPSPLFVQIILQIAIVKFCMKDVGQGSTFIWQGADVEQRKNHILWNAPSSSSPYYEFPNFETAFLQMLTNVFRVASWALSFEDWRTMFEDILPNLHYSREQLCVFLEDFRDPGLELALVDDRPVVFVDEFMEDGWKGCILQPSSTAADIPTTDDKVMGTTGIGLKLRIRRPGLASRDAEDDICLENILPAHVVLEKTMQAAMKERVPSFRVVLDGIVSP